MEGLKRNLNTSHKVQIWKVVQYEISKYQTVWCDWVKRVTHKIRMEFAVLISSLLIKRMTGFKHDWSALQKNYKSLAGTLIW